MFIGVPIVTEILFVSLVGREMTKRTRAIIPNREPLHPVLAIPFPAKLAPRMNPMIPLGK